MTFELLQKPVGTLDLLLYLLAHGKTAVSTILSDTGMNRESFYGAADRLRGLGFAYEDKQTGYPTYVYWGLTRAGEAFARTLGPAVDMLSVTASALERELAALDEANEAGTLPRRTEILDLLADREFSLGRWDTAEANARRLVELSGSMNDLPRQVRGRLALGRVYQKRDRHDDARRELDESLRLATGAGRDDLAAEAGYLIGSDLERQGRWQEALERFGASASQAGRGDDPLGAAQARQATARILAKRGRYHEALGVLQEVAAELEGLRAEDDLPRVYVALGSTLHSLDRPDQAGGWFAKGVEAAQRVGDIRMEAYGLVYGAAHSIDAGEYRKAEVALARGGRLFEDLGEKMGIGSYELNAARSSSLQGRWSEAEDHFDRALAIARETSNRYQEAWALFNRGQMAKRRERRDEARALLTEARRIFTEIGSEARAARCDEELEGLTR